MVDMYTDHFAASEFSCRCGCDTPDSAIVNLWPLASQLEKLRVRLARPVLVTSGYRCISHNYAVGGASRSYHMSGMAADICVPGLTPVYLFQVIRNLIDQGVMTPGGLRAYSTFVHYDIRGLLTLF